MKIRNFVAKHAQRSGAGRHKPKEKTMAEYYRDDWNDADQCQISEEEYSALESQVIDLKGEIEQLIEDEIYVLASIMRVRDYLLDCDDVYGAINKLNKIINAHTAEIRMQAILKFKDTE